MGQFNRSWHTYKSCIMIFKIFVFLLIASINERINAQRSMLRQTIGAATIARNDTRSAGGKQCLQCLQDHAPRCKSKSGVVCAQCRSLCDLSEADLSLPDCFPNDWMMKACPPLPGVIVLQDKAVNGDFDNTAQPSAAACWLRCQNLKQILDVSCTAWSFTQVSRKGCYIFFKSCLKVRFDWQWTSGGGKC